MIEHELRDLAVHHRATSGQLRPRNARSTGAGRDAAHVRRGAAPRPTARCPDDLHEQTEVVWANIVRDPRRGRHDRARHRVDHDVRGRRTASRLAEVMAVRDRALSGHRVASTFVTVPALARPAWRLEIAVVAARLAQRLAVGSYARRSMSDDKAHRFRHRDQGALRRRGSRRLGSGRAARCAGRAAVHARRVPDDVPRQVVDDAPVRRLRHGGVDQRAVQVPAARPARPDSVCAFDLPTQMGYDSDHPRAEGEVGKVGVAIDSMADMRTAARRPAARQGHHEHDDQLHRRRSCC